MACTNRSSEGEKDGCWNTLEQAEAEKRAKRSCSNSFRSRAGSSFLSGCRSAFERRPQCRAGHGLVVVCSGECLAGKRAQTCSACSFPTAAASRAELRQLRRCRSLSGQLLRHERTGLREGRSVVSGRRVVLRLPSDPHSTDQQQSVRISEPTV